MKLFSILMGFFAVCSVAQADTRYDIYCVTVGDAKTVFVYDDLIESYASKYKYIPFTYLREVDVYELQNPLPKLDVKDLKKSRVKLTQYRNVDFPSRWEEKGVLTISGGRVVEASASTITITDMQSGGAILFRLPFVTDDEPREVRGPGLIFNGKPVVSVKYQPCGFGAD